MITVALPGGTGEITYRTGTLAVTPTEHIGKDPSTNHVPKNLRGVILAFVLSSLLVLASLFLSPPSFAQTVDDYDEAETDFEESIEFESPSGARDIIDFDIFEDIARARARLEKMSCGFTVVRSKTVKKVRTGKKGKKWKQVVRYGKPELGSFTILLAVENVKTRDIRVIRVHPRLGGRTESAIIEPGKANGVNTKFTIISPEHHVVLALKRPVRHGTTFREVVYTPYSEGLDIPSVRKAGLEYLQGVIDNAKNDLIARRVRPASCNSFIDNDISVVLAIIEHIDPQKFTSGRYTPEKLINETLVILGTNKHNAYRYSKSKAGAVGLFQFIPATYKRVQNLYPQAGLIRDFSQGMTSHENAAKASFLLFDADMNVLSDTRRSRLLDDPAATGRFLASAYNCGPGRTRNSMERYGDNWASAVPTETKIYLRKFDAVLTWYRTGPFAAR